MAKEIALSAGRLYEHVEPVGRSDRPNGARIDSRMLRSFSDYQQTRAENIEMTANCIAAKQWAFLAMLAVSKNDEES